MHAVLMHTVDLNSDLGESFGRWVLGDDAAMLKVVTSANIACGFHAGDPSVMRTTCELAAASGVRIGAQVSYRDLAGFGRRFVDVPPAALTDEVLYQIGALQAFAHIAGTAVHYVKPHGALYNATVRLGSQAEAVVAAVKLIDPTLPILGLAGSKLLTAARAAGLPAVPEFFADRGYTTNGSLVPRDQEGALLDDPVQVAARAARMVREGVVTCVTGQDIAVTAESICVHGDSAGAVAMATAIRAALMAAGVTVEPFS